MCEWLDKTQPKKFNKFYFFNLREKFVVKQQKLVSFLERKGNFN